MPDNFLHMCLVPGCVCFCLFASHLLGWLQGKEELVLRDFNYCIIDEVDSILIDEARTPLIISGSAEAPSDKYNKVTCASQLHAPRCLLKALCFCWFPG